MLPIDHTRGRTQEGSRLAIGQARFKVSEQRGSNMLQSLALGITLACMPAIRLVPNALLWGYFAFMAIESLPGSQLWDRTLLLLTDPAMYAGFLLEQHTYVAIV